MGVRIRRSQWCGRALHGIRKSSWCWRSDWMLREWILSHVRHLRTTELSNYLQGRNTTLIRRMEKYSGQWPNFCKWCLGRWVAHTEWEIRETRDLVWRKRLYLTRKVSVIHVDHTFDATSESSTMDESPDALRKGRHTEDRMKELPMVFSFFPILNIPIGVVTSSVSSQSLQHVPKWGSPPPCLDWFSPRL